MIRRRVSSQRHYSSVYGPRLSRRIPYRNQTRK